MNASHIDPVETVAHTSDSRGGWGKVCSLFTPFLRLYRHLCRALDGLPYEYESPRRLLGLPLLSVNFGCDNPGGRMRRAEGVVTIGNQATGVLASGVFAALGLFVVAPVAAGLVAVSIGSVAVVSVSVIGVGVVSVAVFALGSVAVGILAVGFRSVGIVALGQRAVGIIGLGQRVRALFPD